MKWHCNSRESNLFILALLDPDRRWQSKESMCRVYGVNACAGSVWVVRHRLFTSDSFQRQTWSKMRQTETDRQRRTQWARDGCSPALTLDASLSGRHWANDKMQRKKKKTSSRAEVHLNGMTSLRRTKTAALTYLRAEGMNFTPSHPFECHTSGWDCVLFLQVCRVVM